MSLVAQDPCSEAVVQSARSTAPCQKVLGRWVLAATILASSMAFIDGTVVNVALPFLQTDLNATAIGVQWVVESYSLFLAALLLVGGSLGDRYGRRKIFVFGVAVFAVASLACGLSSTIGQLIAARAVQGIGGALLVPGSLAIISATFSEDQRGRAIGTWSGFSAMTTAIGPVLGGWLVENISWRAVFFLNLPLAIAVIVISLWRVPETKEKSQHGGLDWLGAVFATLGLGGVVYGLIESGRTGFSNGPVVASLVAGAVLLVLFVFNEAKNSNPMMPLHLFRSGNFAGANLLTLFLYAALSGTFFFFTLTLIQVKHYSATAAGAALLPFVFIMFSLSRWSGALVDRFGARLPLTVGPLIAAVGFLLFAFATDRSSYWTGFFPATVVLGLGMAVSVAPLTTTVMSSVDSEQAGVASGINNAVSRAAGLMAIAVFGVLILNAFSESLDAKLSVLEIPVEARQSLADQVVKLGGIEIPKTLSAEKYHLVESSVADSFISGFRLLMFVSAALSVLSAMSAGLLIGRRSRSSGITDASQTANQPNKQKTERRDNSAQHVDE